MLTGDEVVRRKANSRQERTFECKVYYEDTDCMSVVYHANYVKYFERARTEYVDALLSSISSYHDRGFYLMVQKMEIAFHAPAKLGDVLSIKTYIEKTSKLRVIFRQIVTKKGEPLDYLVTATVTVVNVNPAGEVLEIPPEFHEL
jgi:tol-pal system-associated acyl-CoA thioesterase